MTIAVWFRRPFGMIDQLLLSSANAYILARVAFTLAVPDLPARAAVLAAGLPWVVVLLLMNSWLLNRRAARLANVSVLFLLALCTLAWWPGLESGPEAAALSGALVQLLLSCTTMIVVQTLIIRHTVELNRHARQAVRDANQDVLTTLPNRRSLMQQLEGQALRDSGVLALALIDVDHFKSVNDEYGHARGDEVLRTVAHALRGQLGARGVVGRYGGEEFLCLLPDMDDRTARQLCEDLRVRVAGLSMGGVPVTISVGLAVGVVPVPPSELLKSADTALYRAKSLGRDQVQVTVRLRQVSPSVEAACSLDSVGAVQGGSYA